MDSVELDSKLAALQVQKAALVRQMVVTDAAISATTTALKLCKKEEVKAEYEAEAAMKVAGTTVKPVKPKKKKRKRVVASSSSSYESSDDEVSGDDAGGQGVGDDEVGGDDAGGQGAGGDGVGVIVGGDEVGAELVGGPVGGDERGGENVGDEPVAGDSVVEPALAVITRQDFERASCLQELPEKACRACYRVVRGGKVGTHSRLQGLCFKWGVASQRGRPPKNAAA